MILVTGGAGYIGSHTCIELINSGYDIVVIDNLSNSTTVAIDRVEKITGRKITFIEGDVRNQTLLDQVFRGYQIQAVIHFAGLKVVAESFSAPLVYYNNNLISTLVLCQAMETAGVKKLVFSSSATVYGIPHKLPVSEEMPLSAINPYGRSKLIIEDMLRDLGAADSLASTTDNQHTNWQVALLRYFNPVGAHPSGQIGEAPSDTSNNLMPFIAQTAAGRRKQLTIFGSDYDTIDGTGVRDFIHVVDLAKGHVKAIEKIVSEKGIDGIQAYNLGTGNGISVLQMIEAFSKVNNVDIPYKVVERRRGDVAACYADVNRAKNELDWQAELGLQEMVKDSWNWQIMNPEGYL